MNIMLCDVKQIGNERVVTEGGGGRRGFLCWSNVRRIEHFCPTDELSQYLFSCGSRRVQGTVSNITADVTIAAGLRVIPISNRG